MKLVNPPVAWMLHAGAPRLLDAGVHLPALHDGDRTRVALEAYPGLTMRTIAALAGHPRAPSYKNDAPGKQTTVRRDARVLLLDAIVEGDYPCGVPTCLSRGLRKAAIEDGSGDTLDAIAAAVQAAWGAQRADANLRLARRARPTGRLDRDRVTTARAPAARLLVATSATAGSAVESWALRASGRSRPPPPS